MWEVRGEGVAERLVRGERREANEARRAGETGQRGPLSYIQATSTGAVILPGLGPRDDGGRAIELSNFLTKGYGRQSTMLRRRCACDSWGANRGQKSHWRQWIARGALGELGMMAWAERRAVVVQRAWELERECLEQKGDAGEARYQSVVAVACGGVLWPGRGDRCCCLLVCGGKLHELSAQRFWCR